MNKQNILKISIIVVLFIITALLVIGFYVIPKSYVKIDENNTKEFFATIKGVEKKNGDYFISLSEYNTKLFVNADEIKNNDFEELLKNDKKISFRLMRRDSQYFNAPNIDQLMVVTLTIENNEIITFDNSNKFANKEKLKMITFCFFAVGVFVIIFFSLLIKFIIMLKSSKETIEHCIITREMPIIEYEISCKEYKKISIKFLIKKTAWLFAVLLIISSLCLCNIIVDTIIGDKIVPQVSAILFSTIGIILLGIVLIFLTIHNTMATYKDKAPEEKIKYSIDFSNDEKFKVYTMQESIYVVNYAEVKKIVDLKSHFVIISRSINVLVVKNEDSMSFYQKLQHELEKNKTRKIKL